MVRWHTSTGSWKWLSDHCSFGSWKKYPYSPRKSHQSLHQVLDKIFVQLSFEHKLAGTLLIFIPATSLTSTSWGRRLFKLRGQTLRLWIFTGMDWRSWHITFMQFLSIVWSSRAVWSISGCEDFFVVFKTKMWCNFQQDFFSPWSKTNSNERKYRNRFQLKNNKIIS